MKKILLALLAVCLCSCLWAQEITESYGTFTVTGKNYRAVIPAGRMLTGLQINGAEFLQSIDQFPGTSFFNNGDPMDKSLNRREGNDIICTVEGYGTAAFRFGPDSIEIEAENTGKVSENLFIVFNKKLQAVFDHDGKCRPVSSELEKGEYKWILGQNALVTKGDARHWYWILFSGLELIQLPVEPGQKSRMTLIPSASTSKERQAAAEFAYPAIAADSEDIALYSPVQYQVFQRKTKSEGEIFFSGRINVDRDKVFYRITGKDHRGKKVSTGYKPLKVNAASGVFDEFVKTPAGGWYTIDIRVEKDNKAVAEKTVENVGVGEILVGAGQSNSTNSGQFQTKQTSGMGVSTDGVNWKPCDDPMIGVHDGSGGGSYYPALADLLYKEFNVPIAIASTGHGGTTIEQWEVGGELFEWFMTRVKQLGKNGFRAVLWHQGESNFETPTGDYVLYMTAIIKTSCYEAGWRFPWFVAKVSYHNADHPSWPRIRAAHQRLWDLGVALEGPDTDVLGSEYRDYEGAGIHFSPKGLQAHAELWAEKLIPYIHSCID
ncbi:MAG: hypothetical protein ILO36_09560 [Abditibacteriota bacterium]|nr:hypothetical protein [Abditibacteriota bacterium]